jgi:hypothetical protein
VAGRLEHPQLFDPSQPNRDLSPNETSTWASRYETSSPSSRFETPPASSRIETSGAELADSQGPLQAIEDAAELVAAAHAQLDVAIEAARVAGVSWRHIGTAAGVAFQSLHRRHRKRGAT